MSSTRVVLSRDFYSSFGRKKRHVLGLVVSLFALACASAPPPRPHVELRQAAHDRDQDAREEPPVLHVAPPPAYGHKVVSLDRPVEPSAL